MSLYEEAARLLANPDGTGGTLKSRTFGQKELRNEPKAVYALAAKTRAWSPVLKEVIERSGFLEIERKIPPYLALTLIHDVVLSKKGVAAPKNHLLRVAVEKHKARLTAEFNRARVKRGFATTADFRDHIEQERGESGEASKTVYPRWLRINTLKTTMEDSIRDVLSLYRRVDSLPEVLKADMEKGAVFFVDPNIHHSLAIPRHVDVSKMAAYQSGQLVLQDKASCFPAYLLNISAKDGDIIDACAAPGNKTTHLAALSQGVPSNPAAKRRIFAFERDRQRTAVLRKMIRTAGADPYVDILENTDFTSADPHDPRFRNVTAILLDPSCSGSGIVGRDDEPVVHVPSAPQPPAARHAASKKRKRAPAASPSPAPPAAAAEQTPDPARLTALAHFQLRLLRHAMRFPRASKIAYSTCSVHAVENEGVVLRGLARWERRGDLAACRELLADLGGLAGMQPEEVAEACLRCEKGNRNEGTMGFFVAAFVRDGSKDVSDSGAEVADGGEGEEEWEGFGDEDPTYLEEHTAVVGDGDAVKSTSTQKKARRTGKRRKKANGSD